MPSWPHQWIEAFKPCKRTREAATRPAPPRDDAAAAADLESGGQVLDLGDGEVCVWPRALKTEKRYRMRACAGKEASTVCTALKSFRVGKRAQSTWCDSGAEAGAAERSADDLPVADVPIEENMSREEVGALDCLEGTETGAAACEEVVHEMSDARLPGVVSPRCRWVPPVD